MPKLSTISLRMAETPAVIECARAGSADAFDELVRRHKHLVYRTALKILRNVSDAEDATQECFLKLYTRLDSYREESAFSTWLVRIVMNISLMQLRRRRRREFLSLDEISSGEIPFAELIASGEPSAESRLLKNEQHLQMQEALLALPPALRDIASDRLRTGMPVHEIAIARGLSTAATKSRLLRARRVMVKHISGNPTAQVAMR